jgi:hypothetical protein
MRGSIEWEGQILLRNIEVQLQEAALNAHQWRGQVAGASGGALDSGRLYKLRLEDGRSGDILITRTAGDTLQFRGSGLLS